MSQPSVILLDSQIVPEDVTLPDSDLWSDEPPLESDKHREQIDALIRLIKWWWRNRDNFYAAGNLTISAVSEESAEQRAESAEQEAKQARQRAEQAEQSIGIAASRLLEMGLSLEQVAETLGLSVEQVQVKVS